MLQRLSQDIRYAARRLLRAPLLTTAAVATLALAIGFNSSVFSIVNAVLLRGLPYDDPDRLVAVWIGDPGRSVDKETLSAFRDRVREVSDLAGYSGWGFTLTGDGEPEQLSGCRTTFNLFSTLGSAPLLGRLFTAEEDRPGTAGVVLSYGLWQARFGGRPDVLGRSLTLNDQDSRVVGVMPREFRFPAVDCGLWVSSPIDPDDPDDYRAGYLRLVGRLAPGASPETAASDLRAVAHSLSSERPDLRPEGFGQHASAVPLREQFVGRARVALLVLFAAVGLVLLIACANLVNLLLASTAARRREFAIRKALGASRGRLFHQLLVECFILAALGGAASLLIAGWSLPVIRALLPPDLPALGEIRIDAAVAVFAGLVSLAAGLFIGLIPAARASRPGVRDDLRGGGHPGLLGAAPDRLQGVLVSGQVATATVLVAAACLLLKSFWLLQQVEPGFQTESVLMLRLTSLPAAGGIGTAGPRPAEDLRRALDQLGLLHGVAAAGAVHLTPLDGNNWNPALAIEGRPQAPGESREVDWRVATPDYFRAIGIPLLGGRMFDDWDREGAPPVALVNSTLARRYWPTGTAVGQRVSTAFEGGGNWVTVVGVVGDTRDQSLTAPPRPQIYRPHAQYPIPAMTVVVRGSPDPDRLAEAARAAVRQAGPAILISDVQPLGRMVRAALREPRALVFLFGSFGALSLALGMIGVFGVLACTVGQRLPEFGLRMALGARPRDVLVQVLRRGMGLAGLGVACGLAGGLVGLGVLSRFLFGVDSRDATVFGTVALLLMIVSTLACLMPALRAARIDPIAALRTD